MFLTHVLHYRTELTEEKHNTPEDNPEIHEEHSLIHYAENLDVPIFLIHGANDRRVPVLQARLFRDKLEELGYQNPDGYEYKELGEEGHASSDQDQKLRTFQALADFLDRRIGTEPQANVADD